MYRIEFRRKAIKDLHRLSRQDQRRIADAIDQLAKNPRPPGSTQLRNRDGWRIRVGTYRVLYTIEDERLLVLVVKIGHRREVYRED